MQFNQLLFRFIEHLANSRWAQLETEHHSPYEETVIGHIGPIQWETNHSFVLDHADATLFLELGQLSIGLCACTGTEVARQSGPFIQWNGQYLRRNQPDVADFPF